MYLYRKERRGKCVVSVYYGKGETALLIGRYDRLKKEEDRREREGEKQSFETQRRSFEGADHAIDAFCEEARAVEDAIFLISGYHRHSRTWRRKRNDEGDKDKG